MTRGRAVLLASLTLGALALALGLGVGAVPGRWQLAGLFATCLLVAFVAVLLPTSLRTKLGPLVVAFVTAAGVVPVFIRPANDEPAKARTNTQYLADLVEKGPITEPLAPPLVSEGLAPARIADPSAAKKLSAVQLKVRADPKEIPELNVFAQLEVYPTEGDASARGRARMDDLRHRFETGTDRGTPESTCVYGDAFWICAGVRRFVYAEVTLSPNPNAYLPFATETVAALLRYGDRMTQLATS
jgi:hypothetical protein